MTESARGGRPGTEVRPDTLSGPRGAAREMWVEVPARNGAPAAWCYSDRRSYRAGATITFYLSANVAAVSLRIYRDAGRPKVVHAMGSLPAVFHPVPDRAYETGCDWPVFLEWATPADLVSGGYVVEITDAAAGTVIGHHLVFIRAQVQAEGAIALVAATSTWAAYNDWGGANHYYGLNTGAPRGRSPLLSARRPWARGQVWLPQDAPRTVNARRPSRPGPARYEFVEWAFINGFSKYYALSGWASYERPFLIWAEANGYAVEVLTQDEIHADPAALDGFACAVFVGHDEYWSREMRGTVDSFVEGGGRVARFAGNFLWQIRLEAEGQRQVAYKYDARTLDPVVDTDAANTMTGAWEDPLVGWPGAATFGVNALRGIYAGFGGMARRAARGFNVFRPGHWAFAGTGLAYADMFGDEANIFGFEMDGVEYTFVDGLPVPTYLDGTPPGTQILAMGWATLAESGRPEDAYSLMLGDADARYRAALLAPDMSDASIARHSRGSGMVVAFERGAGEVFTAGTCEWVHGLIAGDYYTEAVTSNVLRRFTRPKAL
ncbi:MAG: N,N-dimethylformamidase beta subunit family domain-containing protein [Janthinobacterium lividum]